MILRVEWVLCLRISLLRTLSRRWQEKKTILLLGSFPDSDREDRAFPCYAFIAAPVWIRGASGNHWPTNERAPSASERVDCSQSDDLLITKPPSKFIIDCPFFSVLDQADTTLCEVKFVSYSQHIPRFYQYWTTAICKGARSDGWSIVRLVSLRFRAIKTKQH